MDLKKNDTITYLNTDYKIIDSTKDNYILQYWESAFNAFSTIKCKKRPIERRVFLGTYKLKRYIWI